MRERRCLSLVLCSCQRSAHHWSLVQRRACYALLQRYPLVKPWMHVLAKFHSTRCPPAQLPYERTLETLTTSQNPMHTTAAPCKK